MNESRLIDLETRLTYQDETLRVLNDALARQQVDLARLERLCAALQAQLAAALADDGPRASPAEERPPHY